MQRYSACDFEEGDTPLHVAIKLGDYRHEETLRTFKPYLNKANSSGLRPVDIALQQAQKQPEAPDDFRQDADLPEAFITKRGT